MAKLGRPVVISSEERRLEIFRIAEKLFGEHGFENVSMSQIATEAGMSKKTLYVIFSDKRELLKSLVSSSFIWSEDIFSQQQQMTKQHLKSLLKDIAIHVLSERHIKLCRLAIAERVLIEGSTQTFYEMGIATSRNYLIQCIENFPVAQLKLPLKSEILADLLFGAIIAKPFIDLLLIGHQADIEQLNTTLNEVIDQCFV